MKRAVSVILLITMLFTLLLTSCGGGEEVAKYNDAKALYEAGKFEEAQTAFEAIKDYEDSKDWIKKCKNAILDAKYDEATKMLNDGNIIEAYEAFIALGDHKDSTDKAASLVDQYKAEKLKNAKVGDVVVFGRYEQDNDIDNGPEDIEWIVLDVKDGKALIISKYVLAFEKYKQASPHSWAKAEVNTFLNGPFYNEAFNLEEADKIQKTVLAADPTEEYSVMKETGKANIFLLNITEVKTYFVNGIDSKGIMTPYAKSKSAKPDQNTDVSEWLLRVVTSDQKSPYVVDATRGIKTHSGRLINGVRPAMWIDISK